MKTPLNDIKEFAAVCGGAGFAFGVSAVLSLDCCSVTNQLAVLSIITLIFAGACFIMDKLCEHIERESHRKGDNHE